MADIERKKVKDILIPWQQVNHLHSTATLEEVAQLVFVSGHTRLPVVNENKVIGILHTKEFLSFRETGDRNWLSIVRPVLKVVPSETALRILRIMQEKRSHMAIVATNEGNVEGIVTLEDIIEEVVGDIYDEDDDGTLRKVFVSKAKSRIQQNKI